MALGSLAVKVLRLEELLAAREAQLAQADESGQEWLADAHQLRQAVGDTLAMLGEPQHEHQLGRLGPGKGAVEPSNCTPGCVRQESDRGHHGRQVGRAASSSGHVHVCAEMSDMV